MLTLVTGLYCTVVINLVTVCSLVTPGAVTVSDGMLAHDRSSQGNDSESSDVFARGSDLRRTAAPDLTTVTGTFLVTVVGLAVTTVLIAPFFFTAVRQAVSQCLATANDVLAYL